MHDNSKPKQLVDAEELARLLRVPIAFLQREARSGAIPSLRAGNQRRSNPEAVEAALARRAAEGDK